MASPEPLLQDNPDRYVMFLSRIMTYGKCIKNKKIFWRVEEIDFSKDQAHWDKMTDNERISSKWFLHSLQPVMELY